MRIPDMSNHRWRAARPPAKRRGGAVLFWTLWLLLLLVIIPVAVEGGGTSLRIETNVDRALINCDGQGPYGLGSAVLRRVPYGTRQIQIEHRDYEPVVQAVRVGWFGPGTLSYKLKIRPVLLTVRTEAGAGVWLNGRFSGKAGPDGVFRQTGVQPGQIQVVVRMPGFQDWTAFGEAHAPETVFDAYLAMTQAKQAEILERQQIVTQLLARAEMLFSQRQYQQALALADQATTLEPQNGRASALREQISQTMRILQQ